MKGATQKAFIYQKNFGSETETYKKLESILSRCSNNDIPKNNVNIKGKNGKVPPTPPIIPSTISDLNHGLELDNI
ncbi:hypothetical protein, partial [Clostridioides difficile]|uniref:hypothetical protein n=1 Tax=Clostridioides difficile TaxID=1496 RepID=UPI00155B3924